MQLLFLFLQKVKRNESTREENNAYFDTSPTTAPKSDEPHIATIILQHPRLPTFNYQPGVHTN